FTNKVRDLGGGRRGLAAKRQQVRRNCAAIVRKRRRMKADIRHGVLGATIGATGDFDLQRTSQLAIRGQVTIEGVRDRILEALGGSDSQSASVRARTSGYVGDRVNARITQLDSLQCAMEIQQSFFTHPG